MPETYFTADTHFGHRGVLAYHRPQFDSVQEHDAVLIRNWNAAVKPRDTIYVVGDFCLDSNKYSVEVLGQLNGRKILIEGNHDEKMNGDVRAMFKEVLPYARRRLSIGVGRVTLCHYPLRTWASCWAGSVHLHGHSHNHEPTRPDECDSCLEQRPMHEHLWRRRIDVGVDAWGLTPVHTDQLIELVSSGREGYPPFQLSNGFNREFP